MMNAEVECVIEVGTMDNANAPVILPYAQLAPSPIVIVWCRLFALGLVAVGLYQISESIPYVASHILNHQGSFHDLSDLPWGPMIPSLVRLGFGIVFIVFNRGIVAYLQRKEPSGDQHPSTTSNEA